MYFWLRLNICIFWFWFVTMVDSLLFFVYLLAGLLSISFFGEWLVALVDDVLVCWKPLDGNFVSQVSSTQLPKLATLLQNATSFLEIGIPFFLLQYFIIFLSALFYE